MDPTGALFLTIQRLDLNIYHYLGGFAGNWICDGIIDFAEGNNLCKGGVFLVLYWYFWFREGLDRERTRRVIIAVVLATLAALIVARTIAISAPFRMRPAFDVTIEHPSYAVHRLADLETWSAFPSDTATYYFALAFGFTYVLPRLAIPMLVYTAGW